MKIHIVQKGDTLWKIAKKYGVNFEELKKLNSQLSNPDMIMPGMKIKVPTAGGTIKKGTNPDSAINLGVKKEVPLAKEAPMKEMPVKEVPIKEVPIKEVPIKEVPVKEVPIAKEQPKAPYTPQMPIQVVPEIDINNYYMMNMQNMTVEQPNLPPKPTNILPEVKEVPKKEIPIKEVPMKEAPVQMPPLPQPVQEMPAQEYCVPVTPIMPGPGFCPPFGGFPVQPLASYPPMQGIGMSVPTGVMPAVSGPGPMVAGAAAVPHHFEESSSFMPQVPVTTPAGMAAGMVNPAYQQPMTNPYVDPSAYTGVPGYGPSMGYPQMPESYPGYPQTAPAGYIPDTPAGYPVQNPAGFVQTPGIPATMYGSPGAAVHPYAVDPAYGQIPYGYAQPGQVGAMEGMGPMGGGQTAFAPNLPAQGLPVGTGAMGDCGCGATQQFVPPTPPIYSAPYTGPQNVAQPPFMNPYGMGPVGGSTYGMPGYPDESS